MLTSSNILSSTSVLAPTSDVSVSAALAANETVTQFSGTHLNACGCAQCAAGCASDSLSADFSSDGTVVEEDFSFQLSKFRWQPPNGIIGAPINLSYSFTNLFNGGIKGGITDAEMKSAIQEAFKLWSRYSPLNFVEVKDSGPKSRTKPNAADIRIGHGDLGGSGGTLGRTTLRFDGELATEIIFDNRDQWETDRIGNKSDFLVVATHEIGHALGLRHESFNDSVMFPSAKDIYSGLGSAFLFQDDINGIRTIYGTGKGSVTPLRGTPPTQPTNPTRPTPDDSVITGTNRNDVLKGSNRAQTLEGRGGDDTLKAGGGNDTLLGGRGNDRLLGHSGRDWLTGANTSGNKPGFRERDVLIGGGDRDVFVLGDSRKVFYNDGVANSMGTSDYAFIQDFNKNSGDKIQLKGRAADYRLGAAPKGTGRGQGIFLQTSGQDELIGVVRGNNDLLLRSSAFRFV